MPTVCWMAGPMRVEKVEIDALVPWPRRVEKVETEPDWMAGPIAVEKVERGVEKSWR